MGKRQLIILLTMIGFFISLAGCGVGNESEEGSTPPQISHDSGAASDTGDIQPDIHTNVPPPRPQSVTEAFAVNFFEKKAILDGFSEGLRNQITKNLSKNLGEPPQDSGGSSDDSPGGSSSGQGQVPQGSGGSSGSPVFYTLLGGADPFLEESDCDPTSEFLCIDAPRPPEGASEIYTIDAGVDVVGRLDLNQLAVFSSTDPVAVVSIFNNDTGGAASEMLIMPEDVESTSDPEIGKFQSAAALGGFGKFTIVVSAYKKIPEVTPGTGDNNELISKAVVVYRSEVPEIDFVEARPVSIVGDNQELGDPIEQNATIISDFLQLKIRLSSSFSPGVQIRFENFDEDGQLRGFDSVGDVSPKQAIKEGVDYVYTGQVVLHQGLNEIRVMGTVPQLEEKFGNDAAAGDPIIFKVYNFSGGPRVKILSPAEGEAVIAQEQQNGEKVELRFCFTLIPDRIDTNGGGANAPVPPKNEDCINGNLGFEVDVFVNGRLLDGPEDPKSDNVSHDGGQGITTASITPDFGINIYEIVAKATGTENVLSTHSGAFLYGVSQTLIEDGQIKAQDLFTSRGVQVDIDKTLIEGDIKESIQKFLDRDETKDFVLGIFKSTATKPGYTCPDFTDPNTGRPVQSNGDTSIDFLEDTFKLGPLEGDGKAIEVTEFSTGPDGFLHVGVKVNGLHGEADLRGVESSGNTFNGHDLGFIPLTFAIGRLDLNLGIKFSKTIDSDGDRNPDALGLDIQQIPGTNVFELEGDGPLGRAIYINSNRNPLAAGLELLDWQQGLLVQQFNTILGGTLLCGIEEGLNNTNSGALGKGVVDLEKLTAYNKNPFRISINQKILEKDLSLDAAINALKGDIRFDEEGAHLRNIPVRVNPGPQALTNLAQEFKEGVIAYIRRFKPADEDSPQINISNEIHKLGVLVGEDAINQALAAANLAGLLDLDIDANFYANAEIIPTSSRLLPNGSMFLANQLDVNLDGDNQNDKEVPVLLRVRSDKQRPPVVTFLSAAEVQRLSELETKANESSGGGGNGGASPDPSASPEASPGAGGEVKTHFQPQGRYFRLSVSGLELALFEQEPKPTAGSTPVCNVPLPKVDNNNFAAKGFCRVASDAKTLIPLDKLAQDYQCPDADLFEVPLGNGDIISRPVKNPDYHGDPFPIYRVKVDLMIHGEVQTVSREIVPKDRLLEANPVLKNILRAKLVPSDTGVREAYLTSIQVLENHSGVSDEQIVLLLKDFFNAAVGTDCSLFNEFKIPIKDQMEFDLEKEGLLKDLGLAGVDLGTEPDKLPEVYIDDNRLYLDVLLFADLIFTEGEPPAMDDITNP